MYGKSYGIDETTALKVAGGFGAGFGRLGLACGAVTGAYMVIGMKHGKVKADDNEAKEKTYARVQEFSQKFIARNKFLNCAELLGCHLGTPEGQEKAKNENLSATVCTKLLRDSAEILDELLRD